MPLISKTEGLGARAALGDQVPCLMEASYKRSTTIAPWTGDVRLSRFLAVMQGGSLTG